MATAGFTCVRSLGSGLNSHIYAIRYDSDNTDNNVVSALSFIIPVKSSQLSGIAPRCCRYFVPAVRCPQEAQAGPDWRYRSNSHAGSQDPSYLEIFLHDRLQRSDIASVMGTLGSAPNVGRRSNCTFQVTDLPLGHQ
jgi:hypothetical protein